MKRETIRKRKRKGQDSGRNGSTSTGKRGKMEWVRQGGMGCYLKLENLLFLLLGCKVPQWKIMCCFVNQLLQFLVSEYFSMLLNFKGLPKEEFVKKPHQVLELLCGQVRRHLCRMWIGDVLGRDSSSDYLQWGGEKRKLEKRQEQATAWQVTSGCKQDCFLIDRWVDKEQG